MHKLFHEDILVTDPLAELTFAGFYERTTLAACDYVLYPRVLFAENENDFEGLLKKISEQYKASSKWVLIFIIADYEKQYAFYSNLVLFRTSLRNSLRKANEYPLPYVWENYERPFEPIKTDLPQIGFCGLASKPRKKILRIFEQADKIKTNFIIRDKFWGGKAHDKSLKSDFDSNMKWNPFVVCQRGKGNFSMRFYQTLSAGRIPVLTNTDLVLPFADDIDWGKYIVMGRSEKDCLQQFIAVFEVGGYVKMQQDCRLLFETYFSKKVYLQKVLELLK